MLRTLSDDNATAMRLAEADLARSGLTLDDAEGQGWFAEEDASAVNPGFLPGPALVLPYCGLDGTPVAYTAAGVPQPFCRVRYLSTGLQGRRYDQPKNSGVQIFVPIGLMAELDDQAASGHQPYICIVEGEKKALACWKKGVLAVGIGGVDCFRESGTKTLHPTIKAIIAKAAHVFIMFDSDIGDKPAVQNAEWRLASDLAMAGAHVHAVRLPQGPNGAKMGADDFLKQHGMDELFKLLNATPPIGSDTGAKTLGGIPVTELLDHDVKPVEELIPGPLQKGIVTFLCGPGGTHKSRLALQWGLCLNAGRGPWGDGGFERITLVYVAAEDDQNELARRTQAIGARLNLPTPGGGLVFARSGKDSVLCIVEESGETKLTPFYHELLATLRNIKGHKLLVLDSAYDFARFNGRAKISEDAVNHYIKVVLAGICTAADATLLIPWHPSQAGSSRGEMDGWSVAWHNAPRARLAISADKDAADCFTLEVVKRNHAARGEPMKLTFHEGALVPVETVTSSVDIQGLLVRLAGQAAEKGMPVSKRGRMSDWMHQEVRRMTARHVPDREIKRHLDNAVMAGELQYVPGGSKHAAGYYPPENADHLSREARKAGDWEVPQAANDAHSAKNRAPKSGKDGKIGSAANVGGREV